MLIFSFFGVCCCGFVLGCFFLFFFNVFVWDLIFIGVEWILFFLIEVLLFNLFDLFVECVFGILVRCCCFYGLNILLLF